MRGVGGGEWYYLMADGLGWGQVRAICTVAQGCRLFAVTVADVT